LFLIFIEFVDLGSYVYGVSIQHGHTPSPTEAEIFAFIGIDSWEVHDRKFFTIIPEFISILLLGITAIVNKTIPNTDIKGFDEFKEQISSNLFYKHKNYMTVLFIVMRFV